MRTPIQARLLWLAAIAVVLVPFWRIITNQERLPGTSLFLIGGAILLYWGHRIKVGQPSADESPDPD